MQPPASVAAAGPATKRPIAVTFVGVLAIVVGASLVVDGAAVLVHGGDASKLSGRAFDLALGVLAIGIGAGALRMRRWAWAALMTWAAIGLAHELLRHFFYSDANDPVMALDVIVVFALTPLDVQIAFGVRPHRNVFLHDGRNPAPGN